MKMPGPAIKMKSETETMGAIEKRNIATKAPITINVVPENTMYFRVYHLLGFSKTPSPSFGEEQ